MLFKRDSVSTTNNKISFKSVDLVRKNTDYTDLSQRFYKVSRNFSKQYAHIYSARLNSFRNILTPTIHKKWTKAYKIFKLCDVREKDTEYVIIGTLFKLQELKPSILKDLSDQLEIIPQPAR